ncbi:MAG: YraN family protein [Verrucomicrobiae bacterium]|nr:YraN family protein [Verrucomicrobiae bacterium]
MPMRSLSPFAVMKPIRALAHRLAWKFFPPEAPLLGDKDELGLRGENLAARFLQTRGYKILLRRFRCRYGEIDLVCRDGDSLAFVEVKARHADDAARPSDAVGSEKQLHLSRCALDYLARLDSPDVVARFDVVEVVWREPRPELMLIENAFPLSEPYRY